MFLYGMINNHLYEFIIEPFSYYFLLFLGLESLLPAATPGLVTLTSLRGFTFLGGLAFRAFPGRVGDLAFRAFPGRVGDLATWRGLD